LSPVDQSVLAEPIQGWGWLEADTDQATIWDAWDVWAMYLL